MEKTVNIWSFIDNCPKNGHFFLDLIQSIKFRKCYPQHVPKDILLKYQSTSSSFSKVSVFVFCCCVTYYHKLTSFLAPFL